MLKAGSGKRKLIYDTMTTEEIIGLREQLNAPFVLLPDAHLWLWTTNPHLPEAIEVMRAWGFDYKIMMTWDKGRIGLGWWLRSQTEHVLLGTRHAGESRSDRRNVYRVVPGATSTLLRAPYRGHSVKPTETYDILEKLSKGPYLELFAGPGQERKGWTMLSSDMPAHGSPYGTGHTPDQQCGGCPHVYHPTEVCGATMETSHITGGNRTSGSLVSATSACPCSYDIDEEGPLDVEKEIPQWRQAFPLSS